jgi:uncharacterized protein (DUF362 family)
MNQSARISVFKTSPATVIADYKRLMEDAGMAASLDRGAETIIKNNISWHLMYPAANTTPWQLEAVLSYLNDLGFRKTAVVQNETVVSSAFKGERLNAYTGLYKKYGVKVLFNFRPADMRFTPYKPKSEMLVLDKVFPSGIRIPDYFIGRNMVHLPTVKCHIYTTMTGAMKNAFGGLLNNRRHYCHSVIHETLTDLLAIQKEIHPGIFTVMDGTTAGAGAGPRTMTPVEADFILAGADSVAIDAVAAKLMGFDPLREVRCLRLAHDKGLGCGDLTKIEISGEDIRNVNLNFKSADNLVSRGGKLFWFGPFKFLQKLMFHSPLVYLFILGSALYHDHWWYPVHGKRRVKQWLHHSKWGKLFQQYKERT